MNHSQHLLCFPRPTSWRKFQTISTLADDLSLRIGNNAAGINAEHRGGCFMSIEQVTETIAGSHPISGTFSLVHAGHVFQEKMQTGPISVHASAGVIAAALASLDTLGGESVHVSRSRPSAEGELTWTVTFASEEGDFPPLEAVVDGVTGTDATIHVATLANGVAPVRGSLSLVVSGVRGEVRGRAAQLQTTRVSKALRLGPLSLLAPTPPPFVLAVADDAWDGLRDTAFGSGS